MVYIPGERIEACRQAKGWTHAEVCRRAALNQAHLWKIVRGDRPHFAVTTLVRLAQAFGVSTDYLLGLKETP